MEVDKTLDKWFDETFTAYQEKVHPPRQCDLLVIGVLRYARHCSISIFILLGYELKLSTMVLLRAYLELYLKLMWCLIHDTDSHKSHQEQVYNRFKRWDYKRLLEQKNNLKKRLVATTDQTVSDIHEAQEILDDQLEKYKIQQVKCIPDIWQILTEISKTEEFRKSPEDILKIYPNIYQKFNRAVHPDMDFIRKMVTITEGAYICNCDIDEDLHGLRIDLLSMSCDINRMIRDFYDWDSSEMQKEYKSLVKQLNS